MHRLTRAIVAVPALYFAACVPGQASQEAAGQKNLHVPPIVKQSVQGQAVDGNAAIDLRVALPLHNEDELDTLIASLYDPNSPHYGRFLTPHAFAARYLPNSQDIAAVRSALSASHLDIDSTTHGTLLGVRGTVADVQAAMGTTLHHYTSVDGTDFIAPAAELQLPNGMGTATVHGLTSGLAPHAQYTRMPVRAPALGPMRFAAPQLALNANAIRAAYNVPASMQGDGQSVGLFQLDHFEPNDIITYCRLNNLPLPTLNAIYIDGALGVVQDANIQVEVTLDIELLHAMAPKLAEIRLYEGPAGANFMQYLDVLNEMANPSLGDKKLLHVLSTSYGFFENELTDAALLAEGKIFKQMAAQGQAFFAAAGDTGAYANAATSTVLTVIDPAAQPYVTSVGGTRLKVGVGSSYSTETAWSQGGGGSSRYWPKPSYQAELTASGGNTLASATMRNIPDVALNADPNTGYAIYVQGGTSQVGGTSCGSPQWAGFLALVNQERAAQNQGPIGFFNPALYALMDAASGSSLMHDVTTGYNGAFNAGPGYDSTTGWGSPNGQAFLDAFFLSAPRRIFTAPNWVLQ